VSVDALSATRLDSRRRESNAGTTAVRRLGERRIG